MDHKEVLDVEEAAALLGVSVWTIRKLTRTGRLPGRKVGKEWRYLKESLIDYLREVPTKEGSEGAA